MQPSKHSAQVHFMLISHSAIYEYVIQINQYEIINISFHNCINQPLECAGYITKTQRKHSILKQPVLHDKYHFLTVFRRKPDLVIPTGQINGTKVLCV